MKIGQLAERTGVSTKAIRYYEEIGVLPEPARSANGYRTYDASAEDRLSFIQDAKSAGLSLLEIQVILELRTEGEQTCHHVTTSLEMRLAEIDRQMQELQRTRSHIAEIVARANSLNPDECNDPNRCQTIPIATSTKGKK